jgi:3-deoxy-D-manno-octulosonic-acid transferase
VGNFQALYERLSGAGAAQIVNTTAELLAGLQACLAEPEKSRRLVAAGRSVIGECDSALEKLMELMDDEIKQRLAAP